MWKLVAIVLLAASPMIAWGHGFEPESDPDGAKAVAAPPRTPAGEQLAWVIESLNGGPVGNPADRFTPRFLEQVPPAQVKEVLTTLRQQAFGGAKVELVGEDGAATDTSLSVVIRGRGTTRQLNVFLAVDEKTHKIGGLLFSPAGGVEIGDVGDWDAFAGKLGELAGGVNFGCYEIVLADAADPNGPTRLVPIYEFREHLRLALGSTFKLWVLLTLAERIAAGEMTWETSLPVREEWKSLPSGVTQLQPAGFEMTLADHGAKMISISDNTATDHLIRHLGREAVEATMDRFVRDGGPGSPFLTTREIFTIKLAADRTLPERYAAADEATRRAMIAPDGEVGVGGPNLLLAAAWAKPVEIERVEWFATPEEICRTFAAIHRLEGEPGMEPLSRAIRINPGVPLDAAAWKSVAFKGGSEPGVLNLTFLMERADGRWFTLSAGWNNPEKAVEEARLIALVRAGVKILEKHEAEAE